jgi:2-polyprenyl-3-methyl-5-hydroxy-6-metoxy-1,4-benzoquinol methylase
MLISPEYTEMNKKLHESNTDYGKSSGKWVQRVVEISLQYECADILDYGCGKGLLRLGIGSKVKEYDPALGKLDKAPADMVVCTDVMEHIEPDCLDAVLDDLMALTKKVAFITVSTRLAKKTLADGRNAHLVVQPPEWWLPKFMSRFKLNKFVDLGAEFAIVLEKKCDAG